MKLNVHDIDFIIFTKWDASLDYDFGYPEHFVSIYDMKGRGATNPWISLATFPVPEQ